MNVHMPHKHVHIMYMYHENIKVETCRKHAQNLIDDEMTQFSKAIFICQS